MAEHECDRQEVFTPPPRPAWMKTLNELGENLDLAGIVALTPESLMQQAVANTGLSDFGAVGWLEPFTVLMRSIDSEAHCTWRAASSPVGNFFKTSKPSPRVDAVGTSTKRRPPILSSGNVPITKLYQSYFGIPDEV